jgi:hypothetical protein
VKTSQLTVRFATLADAERIARFNERLRLGGSALSLSVHSDALTGPPEDGLPLRSLMVAEDSEEIRAGVVLYHNLMYVAGTPRRFCWIQMPLSEGIVDRSHAMAIVQLMRAAIEYEPLLISLGVGSTTEPWSRFAISLGWKHRFVPFFFYPVDCTRVLRGLRYLETRPRARTGARIAASIGLGALATAALALRRSLRRDFRTEVDVVGSFGSWADEVFSSSLPDYPALASRNSQALNLVYSLKDKRFIRLRVKQTDGNDIGWVIVCAAQMDNNRYFGDLKVGVLVDGLARTASVPAVLAAGVDHLIAKKVDVIVANWSHAAWAKSMKRLGFFSGPSNYLALVPKEGVGQLKAFETLEGMHLTRGDSDGMVSFRRTASY